MTLTKHEHWPWRETTTWTDEIEGMRKFKLLYLDAAENPMVDQLWFTSNYGDAEMRVRLAERLAEREGDGATFPEDASWL